MSEIEKLITKELEKGFAEMEKRLEKEENTRQKNKEKYGDFIGDLINLNEINSKLKRS